MHGVMLYKLADFAEAAAYTTSLCYANLEKMQLNVAE